MIICPLSLLKQFETAPLYGSTLLFASLPVILPFYRLSVYPRLSTEQIWHLLFSIDPNLLYHEFNHRVKPEILTGTHLANLRVIAPANPRQGVAQALKQVVAQVRLRALVNTIPGGNGLQGLFRKTSQWRKYKLNFERKRSVEGLPLLRQLFRSGKPNVIFPVRTDVS